MHPRLTKPSHPRMIVAVLTLQEQQQHDILFNTGIHLISSSMVIAYVDHLLPTHINDVLFSINKSSQLYFKFTNPCSKYILKPLNI
jgi:hypothetical protein